MSNINAAAEAAREASRTINGQFGHQAHSAPALALDEVGGTETYLDELDEAAETSDAERAAELGGRGGRFGVSAMLNNHLADADVTALLRADQSRAMTQAFATRRSVSGHVSDLVWAEGDAYRRRCLLARHDCPSYILDVASTSDDPDERLQVALWADHAPSSAISRLALDADPRVVRAAASNRAMPADELHELAMSTDERVRVNVARNENTFDITLDQLERDPEFSVARAARLSKDARRFAEREAVRRGA